MPSTDSPGSTMRDADPSILLSPEATSQHPGRKPVNKKANLYAWLLLEKLSEVRHTRWFNKAKGWNMPFNNHDSYYSFLLLLHIGSYDSLT